MYRPNTGGQGGGAIKGTPLMVNGVLYVTLPDHVWAVDARTGREIWHFAWPSTGGIHIGNRGVAIAGDWLYFETPDCHLVSLNVKDGTERWRQKICDLDLFYYGSVAPVIVKNMVIAGVSGDDLDFPGYVQAHDLATGEMRWKWYVVPQKMGEPGSEIVAERRRDETRRRHDVAAGDLRSRAQSHLRLDRESAAGDRAQEPEGRQSLHRRVRRAQRGHRQDGVVLPVVAARYARLGFDADAGASSTATSTASRASSSRRRRATATSS